jgi:hypothetical protein
MTYSTLQAQNPQNHLQAPFSGYVPTGTDEAEAAIYRDNVGLTQEQILERGIPLDFADDLIISGLAQPAGNEHPSES